MAELAGAPTALAASQAEPRTAPLEAGALVSQALGRLERLEARLGVAPFWLGVTLSLFLLFFLLYGTTSLHGHGRAYFARSQDFFLQEPATRRLLERQVGLENVLLPLVGHATREALRLVGLPYTATTFWALSVLPYLAFVVLFCARFRGGLGFPLTLALCVALFSSGMAPYMLTWGGYVDGLSYLLLLLAYLAIDRSLALAVLVAIAAALNHYLASAGITVMAVSMYVIRRDRRYILVAVAAVLAAVVSAFGWQLWVGPRSLVRVTQLGSKLRVPSESFIEVYGPTPWNFLSAFKLATVPLAYLAWVLFRRSKRALAGFLLPPLAGAAMIYLWVDVTRIFTFMSMPSLLYTVSVLSGSADHAAAARLRDLVGQPAVQRIASLLLGCSLLGLLGPNYLVNNGTVITPLSQPLQGLAAALGEVVNWIVRRLT